MIKIYDLEPFVSKLKNKSATVKEMLRPFKEWLDRKMTERYPDPDERSNEYKKMYFEQGSAHSGSRNVLFNSIILIKTFKA